MSKIACYTVFPLVSALSSYLITKLKDKGLIEGRYLQERGACFKVRRNIHLKFQSFVIFSLQIT